MIRGKLHVTTDALIHLSSGPAVEIFKTLIKYSRE